MSTSTTIATVTEAEVASVLNRLQCASKSARSTLDHAATTAQAILVEDLAYRHGRIGSLYNPPATTQDVARLLLDGALANLNTIYSEHEHKAEPLSLSRIATHGERVGRLIISAHPTDDETRLALLAREIDNAVELLDRIDHARADFEGWRSLFHSLTERYNQQYREFGESDRELGSASEQAWTMMSAARERLAALGVMA
jgi:hypothetical protein